MSAVRSFWLFNVLVRPGGMSRARALWVHRELRLIGRLPERDRSWLERRFAKGARRRLERHFSAQGGYLGDGAELGDGLVFPHNFNGIHVSGGAKVGDGCEIKQHVTIGESGGSAPIIGKGVFLGAGANIIGSCVIGDGAKIGAGVTLVNATVAPGEVIINKSAYSLTRKQFVYPQD